MAWEVSLVPVRPGSGVAATDLRGHLPGWTLIWQPAWRLGLTEARIARVMAKQYREAVGPWRVYLSILDR